MKPSVIASCFVLLGVMGHARAEDPIATDRPDFVESSLTVGDRRVQVETSVAWERDDAVDAYSTPTLLRYGLGQTWELRLETDGWQRIDLPGDTQVSGMSDVSLGIKHHLASSDDGKTSLAWLLHVDLPSGAQALRGHGARPSFRLVAEWELSDSISAGMMPGVIWDDDGQGNRYTAGIFGAVLGKAWNDRVRSFVEVALPQIANSDDGGTVALLDVGSAWLLSNDVQLDAVYSRGLNDRSPDHALGVGLSFRF
ncbi:transporter [Xanthomonas euvesicatoria]|uniref:transporter n=1 Tax=Xanthomonas euvesicatoria TaxID=456327 RepID=UPI001C46D308|nr:transporter [Xanthomonas euvesicatoria]MBV6830347.1 transporter [Xanthomonas campestris pv. viegasii]MBV6863888.1 transporter [Xanthomonas campestris pv. blepharidis]MBV6871916.1 transporter [Xanthomonas campestris pv. veroniae]MCP3047687.1 transporter [Xanthomonas euvesicatoria pv. allii]